MTDTPERKADHTRAASVPSSALSRTKSWAPRDVVSHHTCLTCGAGPDEPCTNEYPRRPAPPR
jgi:hypothetical protein